MSDQVVDLATRIAAYDWEAIAISLDREGWAVLPGLLEGAECDAMAALYGPTDAFRSHIHMARHGFGKGEYRYFAYPLPPLIETARVALYPHIAPVANGWYERMGIDVRFPADHAAFLKRCHNAGQLRATPLLLAYGARPRLGYRRTGLWCAYHLGVTGLARHLPVGRTSTR